MPSVYTSDVQVQALSLAAQRILNTNCLLRLFRPGPTMAPATQNFPAYESYFAGYAAIGLAGAMKGPYKLQSGVWVLQSPIFSWTCTGGLPQQCAGWFITASGVTLYSYQFPGPINVSAAVVIQVNIQLQEAAMTVACP